jgi:hypothetical protein
MRHPLRVLSVLTLLCLPPLMSACDGPSSAEARPRSTGIGAELLTQQEPPPTIDRSIFGDPRGPYLRYDEVSRTAGRWPFYWTRAVYSGYGGGFFGGGGGSWAVDFPKSDQQFLIVFKRLVRINAYDWENPVHLADPNLRKFPLLYMLEVGRMDMTEEEVEGLRGYMLAGGFVIVDDFWGQREWDVFAYNMRRVFPDRQFVDIGLDHPVYRSYYTIDHVEMTPAINNTFRRTECGGCVTQIKGMYDDEGQLMMMVNFNTDLGDAWEWAEDPSYPLDISTYAYEIGTNMIVYAMTR